MDCEDCKKINICKKLLSKGEQCKDFSLEPIKQEVKEEHKKEIKSSKKK